MKNLIIALFFLPVLITAQNCDECHSEITVNFQDCFCFEVESCKDISHVEIHYQNDTIKLENINIMFYEHCDNEQIVSVSVKAGCDELFFENTSCTMPAEINALRAQIIDQVTNITFQVASLSNVRHFEIQASTNGITWDTQELLKPDGPKWYKASFQNIFIEPVVYFRILTLDLDGSYEVTNTIAADNDQRQHPESVRYYDLNGREYKNPPAGFVIIKGEGRTIQKRIFQN